MIEDIDYIIELINNLANKFYSNDKARDDLYEIKLLLIKFKETNN